MKPREYRAPQFRGVLTHYGELGPRRVPDDEAVSFSALLAVSDPEFEQRGRNTVEATFQGCCNLRRPPVRATFGVTYPASPNTFASVRNPGRSKGQYPDLLRRARAACVPASLPEIGEGRQHLRLATTTEQLAHASAREPTAFIGRNPSSLRIDDLLRVRVTRA